MQHLKLVRLTLTYMHLLARLGLRSLQKILLYKIPKEVQHTFAEL